MQTIKSLLIVTAAGLLFSCASNESTPTFTGRAYSDTLTQAVLQDSSRFTQIQWIDPVSQNLGKVKQGGVIEIAWRFKNAGNNPLVIASVTPGCGCTVADQPKEPIAPGAESVIRAKFDSNNQHEGIHNKGLQVRANTSGAQDHALNFTVEVTK